MILPFYSRTVGVQDKILVRLGIRELRSTSKCINKRQNQVEEQVSSFRDMVYGIR